MPPAHSNPCLLQEWDRWKRLEAKAKALLYGWDDISAVNPETYQRRFVYRLRQYFPPESSLETDRAPTVEPEPDSESFISRCVSCSDHPSTHAQRADISLLLHTCSHLGGCPTRRNAGQSARLCPARHVHRQD